MPPEKRDAFYMLSSSVMRVAIVVLSSFTCYFTWNIYTSVTKNQIDMAEMKQQFIYVQKKDDTQDSRLHEIEYKLYYDANNKKDNNP